MTGSSWMMIRKNIGIMQGYDAFEQEMIRVFPAEEKAIRLYTKTILEICDRFPLYRLRLQGQWGKTGSHGDFCQKIY